jgi:tRNA/rRNA methyltransferase
VEIVFILVEPENPENIGGSARAIKTMGFEALRLVNPQTPLEGRVQWTAHGSADILEKAGIFSTLDEAAADIDLLIAASARKRNITKKIIGADQIPGMLREREAAVKRAGIVFGRESSGLTNDEVLKCDVLSTVPLSTEFPSLNLAQAVMVYAYILSGLEFVPENGNNGSPAPEGIRVMKERIVRGLDSLGFGTEDPLYHFILDEAAHADSRWIRVIHALLDRLEKRGV